MERHLGRSSYVNVVAIFGGTHGNETCGVSLAEHYLTNGPNSGCHRDTFTTLTHLMNTKAIEQNTRYCDVDLNRCFLSTDVNVLNTGKEAGGVYPLPPSTAPHVYEHTLAAQLNTFFGPKQSPNPNVDYVIDLHNTTANTGVLMIFHPHDLFSHMVARRVLEYCTANGIEHVRCSNWTAEEPPYAASIGRSGMTFEVGPVSWGVVDMALVTKTKRLVEVVLDVIEEHNRGCCSSSSGGAREPASTGTAEEGSKGEEYTLTTFQKVGTIDYPRVSASIHSDQKSGGKAQQRITKFVHEGLQGMDFQTELKDGATPLFQSIQGETELFSRSNIQPSIVKGSPVQIDANDQLFPYFINEAAYYEKGVALAVAKETTVRFTW